VIACGKQIYWQETALWVRANQNTTAILKFLDVRHSSPTMGEGCFKDQLLGQLKVGRGDKYVDVVPREIWKAVAAAENDPR
jgi:hypothetical protein